MIACPLLSSDVTESIGHLNIYLREGFLHALDVSPGWRTKSLRCHQ
jgi:hypothetical protein